MHWLVSTSSRRCVAFVVGTSNDRMISSGARGRGATDGKASAGLVKMTVEVGRVRARDRAVASHASTRNCRSAEKRLCAPAVRVGRDRRAQLRADLDAAHLRGAAGQVHGDLLARHRAAERGPVRGLVVVDDPGEVDAVAGYRPRPAALEARLSRIGTGQILGLAGLVR